MNSKNLNVVFMGTPDFAVESLKKIQESNHNIVGVITSTDKPAGRGKKIKSSAVKKYAEQEKLNIFQPKNLKDENFIQELKSLNADVFVVVAFRFLPKSVWQIPTLGTFNLHASLLPDYRGAAPINYAVINGEKKSGNTTFLIDEKIDTGNILLQQEVEISDSDSAGDLHDKLMYAGGSLVIDTLDGLANNTITPKIQPEVKNPKLAYKIFKKDCIINWNQSCEIIHNFIRGMSPYPTAFTYLEINGVKKGLKIFEGEYALKKHSKETGTMEIQENKISIYCKDGVYFPKKIQIEGKKPMNCKDFINGLNSTKIKITN